MIGWFRKWWPWGREQSRFNPGPYLSYTDLLQEMDLAQAEHRKAIKAKKKRSHIEARMKEIRTELLRMEAGK